MQGLFGVSLSWEGSVQLEQMRLEKPWIVTAWSTNTDASDFVPARSINNQ